MVAPTDQVRARTTRASSIRTVCDETPQNVPWAGQKSTHPRPVRVNAAPRAQAPSSHGSISGVYTMYIARPQRPQWTVAKASPVPVRKNRRGTEAPRVDFLQIHRASLKNWENDCTVHLVALTVKKTLVLNAHALSSRGLLV